MLSSVFALAITLIYAIFNGFLGFIFHSKWYIAIAIYFLAFALLRFTVVYYKWFVWRKTKKRELTLYTVNGVFFLILVAALIFSLSIMIAEGKPTKLNEVLAVIMTVHALHKLVISFLKASWASFRHDYCKRTIKFINLAETLVAMITTIVTLITTFGDGNLSSPLFLTSSALMVFVILVLGLRMIREGIREKSLIKK